MSDTMTGIATIIIQQTAPIAGKPYGQLQWTVRCQMSDGETRKATDTDMLMGAAMMRSTFTAFHLGCRKGTIQFQPLDQAVQFEAVPFSMDGAMLDPAFLIDCLEKLVPRSYQETLPEMSLSAIETHNQYGNLFEKGVIDAQPGVIRKPEES